MDRKSDTCNEILVTKKEDVLMTHATTCVKLENIMLSEESCDKRPNTE